MKNNLFILTFVFVLISCSTSFLTRLEKIKETNDESYGYDVDNPIRIGYSNPQESIDYTYLFLSSLRDSSNNPLNYIERFSTADPNYEPSFLDKIPKRFDNSISGGILDCYILTMNNDRDTIQLYFDIYNYKQLFIPKGLKFIRE